MDGSDAGEIGGHDGHDGHGDGHGHGHHGHHGHGHFGHHGHHGGWGFASVGDDAGSPDGRPRFILDAPRGSLPRGIDPGLTYTKETFVEARTYTGDKAGILKLVPRGTDDMANMSTIIAVELAKKYGGGDKLVGYTPAYYWEHPTFKQRGFRARGEEEEQGRHINLGGIARNATTIEVLAWPHGPCDPAQELRAWMKRQGAVRLDLRQSSTLPDFDRIERKLLSNDPFGAADDGVNPPNGWFREVKGETRIWREFYQVRSCWANIFGNGSDRDEEGTFLAVFGATWKFDHGNGSADYETRIAFAVYSVPYSAKRRQTFKWQKIYKHREVAEKAAAAMLGWLRRSGAPAAALEARMSLDLARTEPVVTTRMPAPHARLDQLPRTPVPPTTGRGAGDPAGPEADERR